MQSMLHLVKSMCFYWRKKLKRNVKKCEECVCVEGVIWNTNKKAYEAKQGLTRVIPLITYLVTALFAGTCIELKILCKNSHSHKSVRKLLSLFVSCLYRSHCCIQHTTHWKHDRMWIPKSFHRLCSATKELPKENNAAYQLNSMQLKKKISTIFITNKNWHFLSIC